MFLKIVDAVLFLVFASVRMGTGEEIHYLSFKEYVDIYGSYYPDGLSDREADYDKALDSMKKHNANPLVSWKAGVNQFTVMTTKEMSKYYGYMKRTGKSFMQPMAMGASSPEPTLACPFGVVDFDWRAHAPNVVTAVKSQGACGSCWAFAAAAVMESAIALDTGILFDLSPQQLTSCTPNPQECGGSGGCGGATAQLAFNYVMKNGISQEWTWPYTSGVETTNGQCYDDRKMNRPVAGIKQYVQLPANNAHALFVAVQQSPVSVSVAASSWGSYHSGIFTGCDTKNPIINHAVVLMGFGIDAGNYYWLVRNSWSPTWGEKGYIRLQRNPFGEPCGVDTEPLDGFSCKANPPDSIIACGMCGILADSAYPTGGYVGEPQSPQDPAVDRNITGAHKVTRKHAGGHKGRTTPKLQEKFLTDAGEADFQPVHFFQFSPWVALLIAGAISVPPLRWLSARAARNYVEVGPGEV